jgi:hypothetical protein
MALQLGGIMEKPIVFISHITEEREVALALKKVVEAAFINMMDVFVSSDPRSIHLGQEWLQKIKFALSNCAVEIIIASPQSVKRPWINFEAGSGWIRTVPVIPLCHSGMEPSKLPFPLKALQGATATKEEELNLILPVLAEALNSGIPNIDFTEFISTVQGFEETPKANMAIAGRNRQADDEGQELMPHELATFVAVAEQSDLDTPISVWNVTNEFGKKGLRPIAVRLALKILERKELIILSKEPGDGYNNREDYLAARVSDPGWVWLQENKDKLVLIEPGSEPPQPKQPDEIPF